MEYTLELYFKQSASEPYGRAPLDTYTVTDKSYQEITEHLTKTGYYMGKVSRADVIDENNCLTLLGLSSAVESDAYNLTSFAPMEAPAIDLSDPAKVQVVASKYADEDVYKRQGL